MDWLLLNFQSLLSQNILIAIAVSYVAGVLISATPCIYPIIPITLGVIGAQKIKNKLQGFLLSLTYVAGLAFVYSILGIIAATSGLIFGALSTNPWLYFLVGNSCLIFGAWMLDWIRLPHVGLFKNHRWSKNKSYLTVFLIGSASGLVAAPCTAPVLALLLGYVASTGNIIQGGLMLFSFSYGMGSILILLGTFAGFANTIPKPGVWMIRIKQTLAMLMILGGEYFLIKMGQLLF